LVKVPPGMGTNSKETVVPGICCTTVLELVSAEMAPPQTKSADQAIPPVSINVALQTRDFGRLFMI
jgi:hypothetical protein